MTEEQFEKHLKMLKLIHESQESQVKLLKTLIKEDEARVDYEYLKKKEILSRGEVLKFLGVLHPHYKTGRLRVL